MKIEYTVFMDRDDVAKFDGEVRFQRALAVKRICEASSREFDPGLLENATFTAVRDDGNAFSEAVEV
jgi:hypothetical protein